MEEIPSNQNLAILLRDAAEVNQRLQLALEAARPKIEAFHELMDSDDNCTLARSAKIVGWPSTLQEFYQYLVDKRDIYRKMNYEIYPHKQEYWPTQEALRAGYYKEDVGYVRCGDRSVVYHTTKVTPSGLDHMRRLIKRDFDLKEDEE